MESVTVGLMLHGTLLQAESRVNKQGLKYVPNVGDILVRPFGSGRVLSVVLERNKRRLVSYIWSSKWWLWVRVEDGWKAESLLDRPGANELVKRSLNGDRYRGFKDRTKRVRSPRRSAPA